MKKEEDIEKHITEFCNLLNQLTIVGATILDGVVACALLGSMPNSFVSLVIGLLLEEEMRKKNEKNESSSRDLIKMSKIKGRLDPPIPLVMRIVILFDWGMEHLLCFIEPKDSHPNFNWMAIHSQILMGP
jgi:hypothetical protein